LGCIYNIFKRDNFPKFETMLKICKGLNTNIVDFLISIHGTEEVGKISKKEGELIVFVRDLDSDETEEMDRFLEYFRPIGYAAIFLYMQLTSIYRSFGDPVFQMKGMMMGTLINLIADPLFIKGFGIQGAAVATVLSEVLCLIYAMLYGMKKKYFRWNTKDFSPECISKLLTTAIPASAQNCMPALSSMIMVIIVNRFDITSIAAYGVVKNIETILFYPAMAMNMALITIVGQLHGAGREDRIKNYMKKAVLYGVLIETVLTGLVLMFSAQISMAFVKEEAVAAIVSHSLKIISVGYVCYMLTNIFTAKMAGMGKVQLSMLLMFIYYIVIRIPVSAVLAGGSMGLDGMWTGFLVSHVSAVIIAFFISQSCVSYTLISFSSPKETEPFI